MKEKRVADIILSKVDVLIKEKHPDLEGEVVTLLKDVVKELKTWEYFNLSSAALFIYKAVLIRLIRMGMIEDAFKILTSFEGKVLVAYKTKAMISQIIIEIVQIADDPQDAWSYCDKLVHHLNIKDYYQESDITSEQKVFLCHIVLEFLKAMLERFPPSSVVQVYSDIYSLYPSILTLKTFFILARLISKDEVDLIQKVMSIEENSVVGDNSSAFTSLFCALIMSKRTTDAKAVMKPLTLLNLYEITVEMDLKKVNRSGMLNAVGTAYARNMEYENAYKILEKLHNEQQTVSQRLVKTLEFAYYKQGSVPELVKHYLGQISLNPRYLSPKKERGKEGEEFLGKE
ncbi:hypothetical protein FSP39_007316 [Pinctada imbricata]|uniref:Uncharacterized protein n=1 Tax=Pinctada imbricata TaxID=66713 RepID=A0AA89C3E7_PINIB|nr:hypothetical protein FSP39_007316 [Pinctada imbricata]